jgi:ADP-ribosylglycohydrolase
MSCRRGNQMSKLKSWTNPDITPKQRKQLEEMEKMLADLRKRPRVTRKEFPNLDRFMEPSPNAYNPEKEKKEAEGEANWLNQAICGAVLGAAIGDAMGYPVEFLTSIEEINSRYGPSGVKGFVQFWELDGKRFAPYSDDTQMAEVVLKGMIWHKTYITSLEETMERIAKGFVEWAYNPQGGHRAPGNACLQGCEALQKGVHWSKAGKPDAGGCGSVMRAYPFGLAFSNDPERAEHWAVEHSKMTHGDPIALAACAAMAVGMAQIVQKNDFDLHVLAGMVEAASRYSEKTAEMIERAIREAKTGVKPEVTLTRFRGFAAHEAIAAAVYVFVRHPNDPKSAILEAANTVGDSDSIATLVGALVGARNGFESLPKKWVDELERSDKLQEIGKELYRAILAEEKL